MSPDQPIQPEHPDAPAPAFASKPVRQVPPATKADKAVKKEKTSRRPLVIAIAAAVGVCAVIGGTLWWLEARHYVSTDDAFIDVHVVRVAPQVAGRVAFVPVDDNQVIQAGQLLVQIDPATLQAKLAQAEANQANAVGTLAQARAQSLVVEANTEQASAQVSVAEADASNAKITLARDEALVAKQALARQILDDATAKAATTAATLVAAQKNVSASVAQRAVNASQIQAAEAAVKSAAALTEQARLDLSYGNVVASEAGTITHKNVSRGDYVQVGQNLIALVPLNVWVTANFKETQLDAMRVGQPVDIRVDAYPEKIFHGHIDSFQRGSGPAFSLLPPENATGNYVKVVQRIPVKIVFDDPPDPNLPLGPGMSALPTVKVR
jgi:membrane fusion protein (multidrug efflux system)